KQVDEDAVRADRVREVPDQVAPSTDLLLGASADKAVRANGDRERQAHARSDQPQTIGRQLPQVLRFDTPSLTGIELSNQAVPTQAGAPLANPSRLPSEHDGKMIRWQEGMMSDDLEHLVVRWFQHENEAPESNPGRLRPCRWRQQVADQPRNWRVESPRLE